MLPIPPFPPADVEQLARILGDCGTGSGISRALARCDLVDGPKGSARWTKWERLNWVFTETQNRDSCADEILHFIREFLKPVRFTGQDIEIESTNRKKINEILSFSGIEYGKNGEFRVTEPAQTLEEAHQRAYGVSVKLESRNIHPEVLKYCSEELMKNDYFHALLEATKGIAQRIRDLSEVQADGARLIDQVFSVKQPILTFNSLQTETEKSEHLGFVALLKGCFAAVRNPGAHEPRVLWEGEDDAVDYLTLISLLHRKLDKCRRMST